jgi:hypothetical protein
MASERDFVPNAPPLQENEYFIPQLTRLAWLPEHVPVLLWQFKHRFQALFDAEITVPKRLDLSAQFGPLADWAHVLAYDGPRQRWIFQRFAPGHRNLLDIDLTGEDVLDRRYAPHNTELADQLERLLVREAPLYTEVTIGEAAGQRTEHRFFIPMSATGRTLTHALLFSV